MAIWMKRRLAQSHDPYANAKNAAEQIFSSSIATWPAVAVVQRRLSMDRSQASGRFRRSSNSNAGAWRWWMADRGRATHLCGRRRGRILLAATHEKAIGRSISHFGRAAGDVEGILRSLRANARFRSTVGMSIEEMKSYVQEQRKENSTLRQVLRAWRSNPKRDVGSCVCRLSPMPIAWRKRCARRDVAPFGSKFHCQMAAMARNPHDRRKADWCPMRRASLCSGLGRAFASTKRGNDWGMNPVLILTRGMELTGQWAAWRT